MLPLSYHSLAFLFDRGGVLWAGSVEELLRQPKSIFGPTKSAGILKYRIKYNTVNRVDKPKVGTEGR